VVEDASTADVAPVMPICVIVLGVTVSVNVQVRYLSRCRSRSRDGVGAHRIGPPVTVTAPVDETLTEVLVTVVA